MGTTSDKLTYLNTTKTLIKGNLNLGGANISNEPFRVYSSKLIDIYKDFLANGTDTLWDNWNKVNGTGESLTLNNTIKAKIKIEYGGNTLQDGTPTPESPQDIHTVSGDNSIEVVGKNLFDGTGWRLVQSGNGFPQPSTGATIVSSDENNISFTSTRGAYAGVESGFIKVKANETYMLSAKFTTPTNRFFITQYDENKTRISTLNYINVSTLQNTSFTTTNDGYIAIAFTNTTPAQTTYKIEDIQIEKGNQATTYEAYTGESYPISLGDIELCKIGDYQDRIYKDNGKWYLHKEIGKVAITANNNITHYNGIYWVGFNKPTDSIMYLNFNRYQLFMERAYYSNSNNDIYSYQTGLGNGGMGIMCASTDTIEVLKPLIDGSLMYYPLATPTDTLITDSTLISQLEAIKLSYNEQTNISQTNTDKPFILDVVALGKLEI